MNIRQAKEYIKNSVNLYLKRTTSENTGCPLYASAPFSFWERRVSEKPLLWSRLPRRWALPW